MSFLVVFPIGTVEDSTYFVKADLAQGNSGTAVLEEVVNVAIFLKTLAKCTVLVKDWCVDWLSFGYAVSLEL